MGKWLAIGSLFVLLSGVCTAQKALLGGYVSGLYIPIANFDDGSITSSGLIHNRMNFKYNFSEQVSFVAEVRNRALLGAPPSTADDGFMNLSFDWVRNRDFVLNTSIERLYFSYQTDKFSAVLGRQRINWSQTLTFNPNDIFNSYSLFDYDYPERSGSDAVRLSYYPSGTSVIEVAAKLNRTGQLTAAGLHRFNYREYDIQYLAGVVNGSTMVFGGGFSGEVGGVNLRGECSSFYDTKQRENTVLVAIGADYVFKNSLSLGGEILYNQQHRQENGSIMELYDTPITPSFLSIASWTASVRLSYPFTPIFTGGISAMSFIDIPIFYFGPSADISLSNNLSLSIMVQLFVAGKTMLQPSSMGVGYLRLKYNF